MPLLLILLVLAVPTFFWLYDLFTGIGHPYRPRLDPHPVYPGFEFGDLDGDGDPDIVNANADWDTPELEENVAWYENPGPASVTRPRPMHAVYRGSEFYGKEQATIIRLRSILAVVWFENPVIP